MNSEETVYSGGFKPGDEVKVTDGTFAGMDGKVLSPSEAKAIREKYGGQSCLYEILPGFVWIRLVIFGRPVAIMLEPFQITRC